MSGGEPQEPRELPGAAPSDAVPQVRREPQDAERQAQPGEPFRAQRGEPDAMPPERQGAGQKEEQAQRGAEPWEEQGEYS